MRVLDFDNLSEEFATFLSEQVELLDLPEDVAAEYNARGQQTLVKLNAGQSLVSLRMLGEDVELLDDFCEWLFSEDFYVQYGSELFPAQVTDYSVAISFGDDCNSESWESFKEAVSRIIPLDWDQVEETDFYICAPVYGGAEKALNEAVTRLEAAGYHGLANSMRNPNEPYEPTTEEIIAGHILGPLLSGVTPDFATTFAAQGLSTDMLPIWSHVSTRMSQQDVMEIYQRVLSRLTGA